MKQLIFSILIVSVFAAAACEKEDMISNSPITEVPAALRGVWMYGNFSMTEYWNQNPADYIGNGFEMAIAFKFEANGTFTQYFTSGTVVLGAKTYHRSVSKGTVEVDTQNKTIKLYTHSAHYKRTRNGITEEDRDLNQSELAAPTVYVYQTIIEPNGTKAIRLKLGNSNPLTFLQK